MFLMPNAGVSSRSHQALAGSTGPRTSRTKRGRVRVLKIPPNFSFAKGLGSETGSQSAEDRERAPLSCVAKKRSIGGDGAWREKKKKKRRSESRKKMGSCGCVDRLL